MHMYVQKTLWSKGGIALEISMCGRTAMSYFSRSLVFSKPLSLLMLFHFPDHFWEKASLGPVVVGRASVACPKHFSSNREGALIVAGAECPGEQVSNPITSGFPLKAGYPHFLR